MNDENVRKRAVPSAPLSSKSTQRGGLPPMSHFGGGNCAEKKQGVIAKLPGFLERFFGIGSMKKATQQTLQPAVWSFCWPCLKGVSQEYPRFRVSLSGTLFRGRLLQGATIRRAKHRQVKKWEVIPHSDAGPALRRRYTTTLPTFCRKRQKNRREAGISFSPRNRFRGVPNTAVFLSF